jgi:hypothetical protein
MQKTILGLVGALSGLLSVGTGSQATAMPANMAPLSPAQTFGDLLDPIPNAAALLRIADAAAAAADRRVNGKNPNVKLVYDHHHHHHHHQNYHHHHHSYWWWYQQHHHHHHRKYHHHHHHHNY